MGERRADDQKEQQSPNVDHDPSSSHNPTSLMTLTISYRSGHRPGVFSPWPSFWVGVRATSIVVVKDTTKEVTIENLFSRDVLFFASPVYLHLTPSALSARVLGVGCWAGGVAKPNTQHPTPKTLLGNALGHEGQDHRCRALGPARTEGATTNAAGRPFANDCGSYEIVALRSAALDSPPN